MRDPVDSVLAFVMATAGRPDHGQLSLFRSALICPFRIVMLTQPQNQPHAPRRAL